MILRARTCVSWPRINGDIKQLCESCEIFNCTKPQDTLAFDLFEFQGKLFLIIVHRYSKFVCMEPVVDHMQVKQFWHF